MENGIVIKIIMKNKGISLKLFKEFYSLGFNFETIRYNYKKKATTKKFSEENFDELLSKFLDGNDNFEVDAYNNGPCMISIRRTEQNCNLMITIELNKFIVNRESIFYKTNEIFENSLGIVGYICAREDMLWQNVEQLDYYKVHNKAYNERQLIPSPYFSDDKIIDIEQNPGHYHIVNNIWFGSAWAMWFGKEYYNYIPLKRIESFNMAYENIPLKGSARRVLLYKDVLSYEDNDNRYIQQKFKNVTGMDEVAHILMNKPKENIDSTIEIIEGVFEHGGTKQIKSYIDNDNSLIEKSKASKVEICEMVLNDNKVWETVWREVKDI